MGDDYHSPCLTLDYERLEHFRHLLVVRKSMNGDDGLRGGDAGVGDDGDDDERE